MTTASGITFDPLTRPDKSAGGGWAMARWLEQCYDGRRGVSSLWRTADGLVLLAKTPQGWRASECCDSDEWQALDPELAEHLSCRIEWAGTCRTREELISRLAENGRVADQSVAPWRSLGSSVEGGTRLYVSACGRFALWKGAGRYRLDLQSGALALAHRGLEGTDFEQMSGVMEAFWTDHLMKCGISFEFATLAEATAKLNAAVVSCPAFDQVRPGSLREVGGAVMIERPAEPLVELPIAA